jgi:hypothetical protein
MMYKTYISYHDEEYICKICSKENQKITMLEKYGVEYALQSEQFKNKAKKTWIKNLGVDHPSKSKIIRDKFTKTMINRYGCKNALENVNIINKLKIKNFDKYGMYFVETEEFKIKSINTCLEKYNVEKYLQSDDKKNKSKKTCLEKYGVEFSTQNIEILNKILKTSKKMIMYKDTSLFYQGSYEKNFLELCEKLNLIKDIKRGFAIKYIFNDKKLLYFPDFYLSKINLIIEIKSSYWYKIHEERNILKQKTCEELGYNYILILDKNYEKFYETIINLLQKV